jgi:hypothetical protein
MDIANHLQGMEELIKQAFVHVEVIGPHVLDGHYDLIGPNGEIILPQVWETMIEPDWSISMHMWPMPEKPPHGLPGPPPGHHFDPRERRPGSRHESRHHGRGAPGPPPPPNHRGDPRMGPPPPPGWPPGAPPPPRPGAGPPGGGMPGGPPIIILPNGGGPSRPGGSSRRRAEPPKGVLSWMAGSKPKSSGKGIFIARMLQYLVT